MAEMTIDITDVIKRAVEKIEAEGYTVQKWIPRSERLPEVGKDVLILYPYWKENPMQVANLEYDEMYFNVCGEFDIPVNAVTHWMPLPEPPEKEDADDT